MSVCPSVRMSVTLLQIAFSFLFLDGIEPFLWPSVLHVALYKTLFLDFWFRPPNAQNLLPKTCSKLPISWLVWQIDRRCLGLPGGLQGWLIQWNHAKCCGADPRCCGNEIRARSGDPVAYRLVCLRVIKYVIVWRCWRCSWWAQSHGKHLLLNWPARLSKYGRIFYCFYFIKFVFLVIILFIPR